jgi:hypothetical protein
MSTLGTIFNLDKSGLFTGKVKVSDSGDEITEKQDITGDVSMDCQPFSGQFFLCVIIFKLIKLI